MTEMASVFRPDWVSPPGDTIADLLEENGWSQAEFAGRVGYTTKHVNQLINGKASITDETAVRLERVLGSSAQFWLAREAQYRESLARAAERKSLQKWTEWLKEIPLKHMIDCGWVEKRPSKTDQVSACLKFFGVASVDAWMKTYARPEVNALAAFRASTKFEKQRGAVAAWLRQGELRASSMTCRSFDRRVLKGSLSQIRALSNERDPEIFVKELAGICSQAGVAVVFEPAPKGCPAAGATKWLTSEKALLMLSLRYKSNDHLWFAFFHEAGHILLHSKKMLFLEPYGLDDAAEDEANEFAADTLIPPEQAKTLPYLPRTKDAVQTFAQEIGVAPGIVVGRMQHDGLLRRDYLNGLKIWYKWSENG